MESSQFGIESFSPNLYRNYLKSRILTSNDLEQKSSFEIEKRLTPIALLRC